jgi:hypothetical protein
MVLAVKPEEVHMHGGLTTESRIVWRINSLEADAILNAARERWLKAWTAFCSEPPTSEWNQKIDELHERLCEAERDFVDCFHVAELAAHDLRLEAQEDE